MSRRAWSLTKHSTPPECYAGILSEDIAAAQSVAENMQSDFEQHLTPLELCVHKNRTAQKLFNDLIFQSCTAIRLMYELFQRAKWNPRASLGIKILLGLLKTFADNKIVEDLHGGIRGETRKGASNIIAPYRIQDVVESSSVLEERGINHRAKVTKTHFVKHFRSTKLRTRHKLRRQEHHARVHKMPASWTRMLDVRTWTALTEENWERSAAAWAWLKNYTLSRRGGSLPALSLKDGLWSRLVPSHVILCQGEGGQAYASLGNATWASLTWPLNESGRTPDGLPMFQWSRSPTAWL